MNFKEILELIDKVADREISSVEIERAGFKVKIEGKPSAPAFSLQSWEQASSQSATPMYLPPPQPDAAAQRVLEARAEAAALDAIDPSWHVITSPIVGTFYRAPNPESEFFVKEGDRVSKGGILCIIEAMKLMNEIESDIDGVVMKIFPQNSQPVEYGEKLFAIRT